MKKQTDNTIDLEFMKKLQEYSLTERDEEVTVMFCDGFVDEIDFEENEFYYNDGSTQSFEGLGKDDFRFFEMYELEADLDDIFELGKIIKKSEKDIGKINLAKKFTLLVKDDTEFIDTVEALEDYKSVVFHQDFSFKLSLFEFKLIKD